jgi:hypothetical protein
MGRRILASCLSVFLFSLPVFAADHTIDLNAEIAAKAADAARTTNAAADDASAAPLNWTPPSRPMALPALYAGSAALQAFDAYSTLKALHLGATEANPVMKGVVGNPAVFIGIKAAVTAASIVSAEKMWREHHQMRAIVMMAVSNGIMAAVAAHNASVISSMQR